VDRSDALDMEIPVTIYRSPRRAIQEDFNFHPLPMLACRYLSLDNTKQYVQCLPLQSSDGGLHASWGHRRGVKFRWCMGKIT